MPGLHMTENVCVQRGQLNRKGKSLCTSYVKSPALYIGEDGERYCAAHLPDRRWQERCTHTFGEPGGRCTFCGKPLPGDHRVSK